MKIEINNLDISGLPKEILGNPIKSIEFRESFTSSSVFYIECRMGSIRYIYDWNKSYDQIMKWWIYAIREIKIKNLGI
jgi:hypothetical protein